MTRATARGLLFGAALAHAACVGPVPTQRTQAIIGGTDDSGDDSVVFLIADFGQQNIESCTAEVISPHVLLTAGHCIVADPSMGGSGPATFTMIVGSFIDESGPPPSGLAITEAHAHPQYVPANEGTGIHDIAIAVLQDPAPVAALRYNRAPLPQSAVGAATRLVGYGISDFQSMSGAGQKRQTTTPLSSFDADKLHFADGQHQSCYGDSGGPAFLALDGAEQIVGVTSGGPDPCNMGGDYTRVDTNSAFVDSYVNAHDPGFLPAPPPDLGGAGSPSDGGLTAGGGPADAGSASSGTPGPVGTACHRPADCLSGVCELDNAGTARCGVALNNVRNSGCALAAGSPPFAPSLALALALFTLLLRRKRGQSLRGRLLSFHG